MKLRKTFLLALTILRLLTTFFSVTGAKPRPDDAPSLSHYNDVARQLSDLKRDLQAVASGIQQAATSTHHTGAPVQSGLSESKLEQLLAPVGDNTREVNSVAKDLKVRLFILFLKGGEGKGMGKMKAEGVSSSFFSFLFF